MSIYRFLLAGALAGAASPAQGQDAAIESAAPVSLEQGVQSVLDELTGERGLPGASAALILLDEAKEAPTTHAFTSGMASLEDERRLEPGDRLLSGSVGKTYFSALAHRLRNEGKLDFDAPASSFFEGAEWFQRLPNASGREGDEAAAGFTVRHLLRHQSGLPRYVFAPAFWEKLFAEPDKVWEPQELLAYVFDAEPLFAPGADMAYADTNYIVLGMILEKITGEKVYDLVARHFLDPLGLEDTVPSSSRRIPGLIQGYAPTSQAQMGVPERVLEDGVFVFNPQFEWCGGGYANTPADLARWAWSLYRGEAMDGPYLETLLETVPAPSLGRDKSYGLGVIVTNTELGPLHGHDGFMPGYLTAMGYFPEHELAVALQLNTDDMRGVGRPLSAVLVELARAALAAEASSARSATAR